MKIPGKLYHATSAHYVNTIESEGRIHPSADGYVRLATKIDVAIGFAAAESYDRIVVFKVDCSALDGDRLKFVGRGCYLYQGDIKAPELVNRYRSPSPAFTETLKGMSTEVDAWLAVLPPAQQERFLEQLIKQGKGVVDYDVISAVGRSLIEG